MKIWDHEAHVSTLEVGGNKINIESFTLKCKGKVHKHLGVVTPSYTHRVWERDKSLNLISRGE